MATGAGNVLLLALALVGQAGPYRVTLDSVEVVSSEAREVEAAIDSTAAPGGVRVARRGPDAVLRAVERSGRSASRGRTFATAMAGRPAEIAATVSVPYVSSTIVSTSGGTFRGENVAFSEGGTRLRVTVWPAGEGLVRVRVESVESTLGDRAAVDTRILPLPPPTRSATTLLSTVVVPIGSSIVLGGLPRHEESTRDLGEAAGAYPPGGRAARRRDRGAEDRETLLLLTVTEEGYLTPRERDRMIEEMLRRGREE